MTDSRSLLRFFVGFILTATGVRTCPIELTPPKVVVKYGGNVSVDCTSSDSRVESMGWEASQGGKPLEEVKHLTWTAYNLTDWTMTSYCFVNLLNSSIEQCQKELNFVLYTFPETISVSSRFLSDDSTFDLSEHEEHDISCHINHIAPVQNLTMRWYKDDTVIQTQTFNSPERKPVNKTYLLKYDMRRQDHGSRYRCEAHMDLGPEGPQLNKSSQEYKTFVRFGPDVNCSYIELLEGETLENRCPVEGNPTPTVVWLKDGEFKNLSLPLSRENAGMYIIRAEGKSLITKNVTIAVLYQPELTCPSTYTALEYASHHITCTVKGFPEPVVKWFKDGEEVDKLPERFTRGDAGQYVITATNEVSSVTVTMEIIVTYPPSQIAELEDAEVDAGADVSLKCASVANPRPNYTWTYYRTSNVKEHSEDGVSWLIIQNATAYNRGSYTCEASNEHGDTSKTVLLTVRGTKDKCPLTMTPERMVIEYQGQGSTVECKETPNSISKPKELFWESTLQNNSISTTLNETWRVDTNGQWNVELVCIATFDGIGTCNKSYDYTLYKKPDDVFISSSGSLVLEGHPVELQCHITNVAPARSLEVRWYQGNGTFESQIKGPLEVTNCSSNNNTNCNISMIRSPVNVSSAISVTLNRIHRSLRFRCEVVMNLGPDGPQPPPNATSNLHNITVYSKPIINTENLPDTMPVFRGYPENLDCKADGYPPPKIQWSCCSGRVFNNTLTVTEAGLYNCTATNEVGSSFHVVEVVFKEDYLPLIAGFVAVTVVAISVIFLFIYSIYYKNTKMRRYSLKNPKLSNHNGNVAHNGWDMQFPMTKLS